MFLIKYRSEIQFLPCFICVFCKSAFCKQNGNRTGNWHVCCSVVLVSCCVSSCSVVVFSLVSPYQQQGQNQAKRLQAPPFRFLSDFRFFYKMPIYKLPNKICETRWVSHIWKWTFRGVFVCPDRQPLWSRQGRNEPNTPDRTYIHNFGVKHSISS